MTVQFKLGFGDHRLVEDFLATGPEGVSAVLVDAEKVKRQQGAIDAAREHDLGVVVETHSERVFSPGFDGKTLPYAQGLQDLPSLRGLSERAAFVESVLSVQEGAATIFVAPHVLSSDDFSIDLNVSFMRLSREQLGPGIPLRVVAALPTRLLSHRGSLNALAGGIRQSGASVVELRVSPFGAKDEGVRKVGGLFHALGVLRESGARLAVGFAGRYGEAAVALGAAEAVTTGVGLLEQYDLMSQLNRQGRPPKKDQTGGPVSGVWVPGLGLTMPAKHAKRLYEDKGLRSMLRCKLGECANRIDGPLVDPRGHYLHALANQYVALESVLPEWRPTLFRDEIRRSISLAEAANAAAETQIVELRGLRSLESVVSASLAAKRVS